MRRAGVAPLAAVVAGCGATEGEERAAPAAPPGGAERAAPADPGAVAPAEEATPAAPTRQLVLVRRRGGLPPSWVRRLRRRDAVEALAEGSRTQWLLRDGAPAATLRRVRGAAALRR